MIKNSYNNRIFDRSSSVTFRPGVWFRVLFGVTSASDLMEVPYNRIEFGTWNPSKQRSMIIKQTEEVR